MRRSGTIRAGFKPMGNFPSRRRTYTARSEPLAAYLGGFAITGLDWLTSGTILVTFTTTYTGRHHQLYAGRTLIGQTVNTTDTTLVANLRPSLYPQFLQLVSVAVAEQFTDYGETLPDRPYNVVRLTWETAGSSDTKYLEVTGSTDPGDVANRLYQNVLFDADRKYVYTTEPLEGSGTWSFEVAGIDNKPAEGNRGTARTFQATGVLACPPDLVLYGDGDRLRSSTTDGLTTLTFNLPAW